MAQAQAAETRSSTLVDQMKRMAATWSKTSASAAQPAKSLPAHAGAPERFGQPDLDCTAQPAVEEPALRLEPYVAGLSYTAPLEDDVYAYGLSYTSPLQDATRSSRSAEYIIDDDDVDSQATESPSPSYHRETDLIPTVASPPFSQGAASLRSTSAAGHMSEV